MQEIIKAIEEASIEIKELIETGDTGKSDQENSTGDTQLKLDIASDIIIERIFKQLPTVKAIVSEEQENIINLNYKTLIKYYEGFFFLLSFKIQKNYFLSLLL